MHVKRLQQFVNFTTGQKIRVTKIDRVDHDNHKFDKCTVYNVLSNGMVDKKTKRIILADSIRRRYTKFNW